MTNKVIKALLEAKFGDSININGLMEIMVATGNEMLAMEILLGLYEAPVIPSPTTPHVEFIEFNKFTNEVLFRYPRDTNDLSKGKWQRTMGLERYIQDYCS